MQVKQLLEQRFPGIKVIGSNYPVPPLKQTLAQIIGAAQMGALAFIFFGPQVFAAMGQPQPPDWYTQMATNKFGVAIGVWFVGNMLVNKLTSTGAFEIYCDGNLVSSRGLGSLPGAVLGKMGVHCVPSDVSLYATARMDAHLKPLRNQRGGTQTQ